MNKKWVTRDGRRMDYRCMTCTHIRNSIAMILRTGWRLGWLDILTDEYARRCHKPKLPDIVVSKEKVES